MNVSRFSWACLVVLTAGALTVSNAAAAEWFVAPAGNGDGTSAAPFGRIQDAIAVALPGDVITVRGGTYSESLRTVRNGATGRPITVRAADARGSVIVTFAGRVITVNHAFFVVEGLVIDGRYGADDTIRVSSTGDDLVLRDLEVRHSTLDLVDLGAPSNVLIENCLIHHALNAAGGRTDAHGIVAGPVQTLTIRNTEIHTFSGDAVQVDPGRSSPGWKNVTLDGVRMWLAPLPEPVNGFAAGIVPGENGIDTKAASTNPRATLTIRNTTAWGFRNGLINNMAAFNLKESIDAVLDGVTVYDSEIAFRLRGGGGSATSGAWVTLKNAVVHDVAYAYRYEDDIRNLRIWNNTLGMGVGRAFRAASSDSVGLEVRNLLMLGTRPPEAADSSNLVVAQTSFVNAGAHDYRLAAGSPAIDAGVAISGVATDRNSVARPSGAGLDVGAYEFQQQQGGAPADVIAHAANATAMSGRWQQTVDPSAASGIRMWHPDEGKPVPTTALAQPADYFEVSVEVEGNRPYRMWLRGRAEKDQKGNDSVFVQFSGAVNAKGEALNRIGTKSAATVKLEDCKDCGLSGWGWQDNGFGVEVLGPLVRFATSGTKRIRIQTRGDGVSIDQIVLSPLTYLTAAPGALKNDVVILPEH